MRARLLAWLAWDTDRTDIDLHVVEPGGEEVYYGHRRSSTGGFLSKDFTQGYGPEVYLNRNAPAGTFRVRSKYYSSHQVSATTGATCAVLWRVTELGDFDNEELSVSVVRLNRHKQVQDVLHVELPEARGKEADGYPCAKRPRHEALLAFDEVAARAASGTSVRNVLDACCGRQGAASSMPPVSTPRAGGPAVEEVD